MNHSGLGEYWDEEMLGFECINILRGCKFVPSFVPIWSKNHQA